MKRKLPGTVDVVRIVILLVTTYLLNKIKTFIRAIEQRFIWYKNSFILYYYFTLEVISMHSKQALYINDDILKFCLIEKFSYAYTYKKFKIIYQSFYFIFL